MKKFFLCTIFLTSFLCGIVFPETTTLTKVGEYGTGFYLDVFVQGNYAYCAASGAGLDIINISTPTAPVFVANIDTPGEAKGVYVSGSFAYVADGEGGLQIVDVTTPASPHIEGSYDTPGDANAVFVSGSFAYVADGGSGLRVVDVTAPALPHSEGVYDTPGFAWEVYISGSTAYVADGTSGVTILNISTPATPTLLGSFSTAGVDAEARGIWVSGIYAYVAYWGIGFRIYDVSAPASVTPLGYIDGIWEAWAVHVDGNYAYVAGDGFDLKIINVSVPLTPVMYDTENTDTGAWGKAVYYVGNYVYLADYMGGLQIFSVTDPSVPVWSGSYERSGYKYGVSVSGNYAYMADRGRGLEIFNISTPSSPTLIHTEAVPGDAMGLFVRGGYAYVAVGDSGLSIVDISTPSSPSLITTIDTPGFAWDVFVDGNYAYVADDASGLQIIDISTPAAAHIEGFLDTTAAYSVFVTNNYAYVADGPSGLQIINVTTPASPSLATFYNTSGISQGIYVSGDYAYIADYDYGLQIVNISNSPPTFVGAYDTPGLAYKVVVNGHYAYVADYDSGLQVINVSSPSAPTLGTSSDTAGFAWNVFVGDNYAYLADGNSGKLYIYEISITLTVSGRVRRGGVGLEGVVMNGLPGTPTTNSSGVYTAAVSSGWSGTVTPSITGNVFIPASITYSSITSDQTNQDYTAGYTVSGTVLRGGLGLEGVVMNGLTGNPTTNSSGVYSVTVEHGFSGTATPTLAGNTFAPPSIVYTNVTSHQTAQDYTATLLTYTITGTVTRGGVGLAGVVMNGLTGNPATNGSGVYSATVDYGFSGTATPTLAGYTFTPPTTTYTNVTSNQTAQDYEATLLTYTITGTVTREGSGLAGVVMNGLTGNPATNGSGVYTATVDYGFSGTATPTLAGYTFTPPTTTYTNVTSNQTAQDYEATLLTYTITGTVTRGGVGLAGVVMNGLTGNPTTNGSGVYTATVDYGFSGTATPTLAGYTFTPPTMTYTNVTSNQTDQDYTATLLTYTITGTVTREGSGLAGVVMNGLTGNPTTNSSGVYTATVDYGFSGTATPTYAGVTFTPPTRTYTNVTSNQTGQDYTAVLFTYTISGTITAGGAALPGVVVSGLPGNPATNSSGVYTATVNYGFSGTATPILAGYSFTPPTRTYTNVTSNQTGEDFTAALLTYTISGTITAGGAALPGVVVSGLPGSPTTNSSGVYAATVDYGFSGTATPVLAGYAFTPPSRTYSSVTADQTGQDYTSSTVTLTISGTITSGGSGLQGVVMTGLTGSPAADSSGVYTATVDYGFSGTATPTLAGYTFTPPTMTYTNVTSSQTGQDYTATLIPPPVILLSRSRLNFGATTSLKTSDQKFTISNSGSGTLDWSITDDAAWLSCSSTSGTGGAEITVAVDTTGLTSNTYNATITVSSTTASNSPQTVTVSLVLKPASQVQNPFGFFDTPVNGTTGITGAIPVTGWALDDIEVTRIEIKRDPVAADPAGARGADGLVFIGDAVFVEEARPDVEQAFPNSPLNYRAGWGYMLLTYGLPDQGNGSYKLYAFAHDKDGHRIGLGNKTIQCDNAHATKPFGTLDTPSQGGTASGTLANFGWALTPMPNEIPRDGSTISVYVDGVYLGHPVYNLYRADIATAFPGYANSDGAVGLYEIDTTPYSNLVHTIGWQVTDNNGNSEGIGSRFFTVFNSSPAKLTGETASVQRFRTALSPDEIRRLPARSSSVQFRKGVSSAERWQLGRLNREGTNSIQIREVDRVEIQLGQSGNIRGFMVVGKDLRPLPVGSTLDGRNGTFYWQPGPGFKGDYNFVFIGEDASGRPVKTALTVTIAPKS